MPTSDRPDGWPGTPVPCGSLISWVDLPIRWPCEAPALRDPSTPEHVYLRAAAEGWHEHPEWMDFLALDSPVYHLKRASRDLYLHAWKSHLNAERVLDVGCGIGRIAMTFLDRGATVIGVDGDPESLQRCAWHAAGRAGSLDLHWSTVHALPEIDPVDVVVACEVLCYIPDIAGALQGLVERLRIGGVLLLSMEAPWGWAAAEDAPSSAMDLALAGPGVIDLGGERWVRTFDESGLRALLEQAGLQVETIAPTHYGPDGPLERCLNEDLSLETLLHFEASCRQHPVWSRLHRIWTVTARRVKG